MLHETIRPPPPPGSQLRRSLAQQAKAFQHRYDIVSNGYNIVLALQRCVALKIVVANRPL